MCILGLEQESPETRKGGRATDDGGTVRVHARCLIVVGILRRSLRGYLGALAGGNVRDVREDNGREEMGEKDVGGMAVKVPSTAYGEQS